MLFYLNQNISTEKRYNYLFDDQIPTVPSDAVPRNIKRPDMIPMTREQFIGERQFKNKLEEIISNKIREKVMNVVKTGKMPQNN